jgi:hypothetical protein
VRHEWSPPWAQHVLGHYFDRDLDEFGRPEGSAEVGAECTVCKNSFKRQCDSGAFRRHIAAFAMSHLHRDRLDPIPKETA